MDRVNSRLEIKEISQTGTFCGYGSVYGVLDDGDDVILHGAFAESLADSQAKGIMPALLWQHRSAEPVGCYTKMSEDATGLYVEGKLALKTQRGAEAYELMSMKAISGLSVGFMTREDSYDQKTGVRTIKKGDLWECSLVTFPMNGQARVSAVKGIEEIIDFKSAEKYLRESGGLSRTEATALVARIKGLAQRDSGACEDAFRVLAAVRNKTGLLKT